MSNLIILMMATKVTLRRKTIKGGKLSLYLDFYPPVTNPQTGETSRREFLRLHIFAKPKTALEKIDNQNTINIAEQICLKRQNEVNKPEIYSAQELEQLRIKELGERDFVQYFKQLADKRKSSNHDNWISSYKYLHEFTKGALRFSELNEGVMNDFKEYLLTTKSHRSEKNRLATNSAVSYFNKVKAALREAYKDGYLQIDLNARIPMIEPAETQRNFLTIDELNSLIKTECHNPLLKNAALFSALTGLRFSDIQKMAWGEVEGNEAVGYKVRYIQKKTQKPETLPISGQAFQLMGERREPRERVFEGLTYSAYSNKHLFQWIGAAGITKEITFHCFRHTFATLQLSEGTDIYTVSKMLGHRDLKTTQIYGKIVDKLKREAADKIKLDF